MGERAANTGERRAAVSDVVRAFLKLGAMSYGGPAIMAHAIVDAPTALIAAGAILGLLYARKLGPLSLMLLGGGIGALIRSTR